MIVFDRQGLKESDFGSKNGVNLIFLYKKELILGSNIIRFEV